ncbi:hypothetical protein HN832_04130 [archaeon]|jgi:hypothetical protein|nr:hypothetical protein [archaeon]MBT4373417.1 hypothetical protein [archaeon]MBT4531865.1 hypothetical protein [archaeon]MBT7001532.1 hypothetical protein [archaeon]MBT7282576.1 hypothetical protein [archaeon]
MFDKDISEILCYCCGEEYSIREFNSELPLEFCGECGAEFFLPKSHNPLKGYKCLDQYYSLLELLPPHLLNHLPLYLTPQLSPQRIS